jgi:hypothetical protein
VAEIKIAIWLVCCYLDAFAKLVRYLIKTLPADISVGGFGDAVVAGVNAEVKLEQHHGGRSGSTRGDAGVCFGEAQAIPHRLDSQDLRVTGGCALDIGTI